MKHSQKCKAMVYSGKDQDGIPVLVSVDGCYAYPDDTAARELVVHRTVYEPPYNTPPWLVSHRGTGYSVAKFRTRKEALLSALWLQQHHNWRLGGGRRDAVVAAAPAFIREYARIALYHGHEAAVDAAMQISDYRAPVVRKARTLF